MELASDFDRPIISMETDKEIIFRLMSDQTRHCEFVSLSGSRLYLVSMKVWEKTSANGRKGKGMKSAGEGEGKREGRRNALHSENHKEQS